MFAEVSAQRFVRAPGPGQKPDLHGFIAVLFLGPHLDNWARSHFDDCAGDQYPILHKNLRHANFSTQQPTDHGRSLSVQAYNLISTSTPADRSSFMRASTVCGVGSRISSNRLWVRSSNCSRDFLSTCGDRRTVKRFFTVGRGMGPKTFAPVRFAVSTISVTDWSRMR